MRWRILSIFLSLSFNESSLAQTTVNLPASFAIPVSRELNPFFTPSEGQISDLLKGEVISVGNVTSVDKNQQKLMTVVAGLHPRNCTRAMRKLSLYENYSTYMDFIKTSQYNEKTQKFTFTIEHTLLPYTMNVGFKIPRITKEGVYPFTFEDGFLKNLQGKIMVKEIGKYCLLSLKADWTGPETSMPNLIFGTFVQTVGKLGLEHLIRVSRF